MAGRQGCGLGADPLMIPVEERLLRLATSVAGGFQAGQVLGLGSGSTAEAVVRAIGERMRNEPAFRVTGVATSVRTGKLARSVGVELVEPDSLERIDLGFDGADEIDPDLNLVKGRGGALLYEKLIAEMCDEYLIVSSSEKLVERLGTRLPLPVEVIPFSWPQTARRLEPLGLLPALRMDGDEPYRSDAGNLILDCAVADGVDLVERAPAIKGITGVVEHGIFLGLARRATVIEPDGDVRTVLPRTV
ncbi:MAG: ribose 5-phosphate isomerase A [Chloroflexota bacterium]|nr:ribose 5-phosphate isomerase A [Chloroflexota bacterium]